MLHKMISNIIFISLMLSSTSEYENSHERSARDTVNAFMNSSEEINHTTPTIIQNPAHTWYTEPPTFTLLLT